jgi:hypothetical protein
LTHWERVDVIGPGQDVVSGERELGYDRVIVNLIGKVETKRVLEHGYVI